MTTTNAIYHIVGSQQIDRSVVPYIHAHPIMLTAQNLRPGACAYIHVDDVCVNQFVQSASILTCNVGFQANVFGIGEGLYCNTTHAYANVMETSVPFTGGHYIYINENFLSLNLATYGPANSNTFSASNYSVGELVFQTVGGVANAYANTYIGRVAYWAPQDGALALTSISGTIANVGAQQVLFKSGSTQRANVVSPVIGNKFPSGIIVASTANVNAKIAPTAYNHQHGVIANVSPTLNTIQVSGSLGANMVGQMIQFVNGVGVGQNAKIIAISANGQVTLNTTLSVAHSGNTHYAIVANWVNHIGWWHGWYHWQEDYYFNFQVGYRLIVVNDAPVANSTAATMKATGTYVAAGQIAPAATTPVVPAPPIVSPKTSSVVAPSPATSEQQDNNQQINNAVASSDPLVQTFFTPKPSSIKVDNGVFATSVDLFFASKPTGNNTQFPVSAYVVEVVNGFPTTKILAHSTVRYEGVQITDGKITFPSISNTTTNTHFVFDNPVHLLPGTEYGLVVYSESPDYYVWVADLGQPILNSTRIVSASPYIGSFFKSQNATAWTPIQNRSLMFNLNKAQFDQNPVNLLFNLQTPFAQNTYMDTVLLHSSDVTFPSTNVAYGIKTINANTGAYDANFFSLFNNNPFSFGGDLSTSSISSNRRRIIPTGNLNGVLVNVNLSSTDPDVSPFFHSERLSFVSIKNQINPGGIQPTDISITSPGNHINAANIVVTIGAPLGDAPIQATANVLASGMTGNSVMTINIINPGSGYVTTPTITITEPSALANATAQVNGEDQQTGGNGYARYVTRQITLADGFDAGDIQIFMQAVRPQGTDIDVYYKILGSSDQDVLANKRWVLMNRLADVFSPDQETPINLSFNTGLNTLGVPIGSATYVQNGVQYPIGGKFKSFAIKIVLFASDPTVVPVVNNFRGIAVPAG